MSAEPMLGDAARAGAWTPFRVRIENDGPDVSGELRLSSPGQGASSFGVPIQLANGARQEHFLYGLASALGTRFTVTLVSDGLAIASAAAPVTGMDAGAMGVFVVAEHPEALVTSIRDAATLPGDPDLAVVAIDVDDLPLRVEAWAAVDLLVWQDVNTTGLDGDQLAAMRTWVATGGDLVIVGGSTGAAMLGAFPSDLLPYQPARVIDVPTSDLEALLGLLPDGATALPALAGSLERGKGLAQIGGDVFAARAQYGQGSVALIGIDPSTAWLAGSPASKALWAIALPSGAQRSDPVVAGNDDFIALALSNLPSAELPRMEVVFLLILAYVIALGPLNYVILRRRDRREWAWLTMPAVILFFAVTAYGFGALLNGAKVIINELSIVHGAAGTDRGVAEVHIGIFSPNRSTFDVKVSGNPLLTAQRTQNSGTGEVRPLDILLGDPATVRGYSVGFGVLRGFRAEAAVSTPRIDADLRLIGDALQGTITNSSGESLAHVSLFFGGEVQVFGEVAIGETRQVNLDVTGGGGFLDLVDRLLGPYQADATQASNAIARRAIIQHLSGGWSDNGVRVATSLGDDPVILAFRTGTTLDVDVGAVSEQVGETLFVLPAHATVTGPVVVAGGLIRHVVLGVEAVEGQEDGGAFLLGRGTMTVEYRPVVFDGSFVPSGLSIRIAQEDARSPVAGSRELLPLPPAEQPDPEDPLGSDPRPGGIQEVPRIQLFDRVAGTWIEFEPAELSTSFQIPDAGRYVDSTGSFRVRFVVRDPEQFAYFSLAARLEGTVE